MSPPTTPPCTPEWRRRKSDRREGDTEKRTRFFTMVDTGLSIKEARSDPRVNIHRNTATNWLKQRANIGSPAYRRIRKEAMRTGTLGHPRQINDSTLDFLHSAKNPHRRQNLEFQLDVYNIPVIVRCAKANLSKRKDARRYKMRVVHAIAKGNMVKRVVYGHDHKDHTVENYYQYVVYRDEACIDPTSLWGSDWILRQRGTAYEPENTLTEEPTNK
ncbi:hypothetical protein EJ08DRAFT_708747 [Tothia fuscella]|uniref:Uncharacterized protein n=1 Tax=Tothia fuscella TaxID=1048955 RepID=A0A9P4NEF6_9PEZI|nr:hypothetical protein EJ08DRAFT_708747 [Tothia fuscella]